MRSYYDDDPRLIGTVVDGVPVHGPLDCLAEDLRSESADQVWIALPLRAEARIRQCVDDLRATPAVIRFVPDIYGFHLLNHSITEIEGKWYIFYHDSQRSNGVNHLRNVKQPIEIKYNDDGTIQPIDPYFADAIPPPAA